jgi:replicative DNA helicase
MEDKIIQVSKLLPDIGRKTKEFIPTKFPGLDKMLDGGFAKKELVVIGGPSGVGKSFLGCQLLINSANNGFKTLFISLEISTQTILSRILGNYSNIKPFRLIAGLLDPDEYERLKKAKVKVKMLEDYIYLTDEVYTLEGINQAIDITNPDMVVVDFIQSIIVGKSSSEYDSLSKSALSLQRTAKKKDCAIVVFSQLSNRVASTDGEQSLLEFKGSGTIAQVADLGFWLYDNDSNLDTDNDKLLTLALRKNRRGAGYKKTDLKIIFPRGKVVENERL